MYAIDIIVTTTRWALRLILLIPIFVLVAIVGYIAWRFTAAAMPVELPNQLCNATPDQAQRFEKFRNMYKSQLHGAFGIDVKTMSDIFARSQEAFETPEDYVMGLHAIAQAAGGVLRGYSLETSFFISGPISTSYDIDPYRVRYISPLATFILDVSPRFYHQKDNETLSASLYIELRGLGVPLSWPLTLNGVDFMDSAGDISPGDHCLPVVATDEIRTWITLYRSQYLQHKLEETKSVKP